MFSSSSNYVTWVDGVFLLILLIGVIILIGITIATIYFVIKYNRKRHPYSKNIEGNLKLEILWTVIPVFIVIGMFWYGWLGYKEMQDVPENAFIVKVTGKMWKWDFLYPNGLKTDTLYIPINKPIKLELTSVDVNHSLYIPALRIKRDVYPNKDNFLWFIAEKEGHFDIACAEYCGLNHSYMYSKVVVLKENEFNKWYVAQADSMANNKK